MLKFEYSSVVVTEKKLSSKQEAEKKF